MKWAGLFALLGAFLLAPVVSEGQGFRGSTGSARHFGTAVQNRPTMTQTQPGWGQGATVQNRPITIQTQPAWGGGAAGTVAPVRIFSSPRSVQIQSAPLFGVQGSVSRFTQRGPWFVSPSPVHNRWPVFVIGAVPNHHHRPWFFWRTSGIVIVDGPYLPVTTVITQVAPGVVQEERRYPEPQPSDSRTRAPGQLAPFDPTPQDVVERMLALANVTAGDVLYDLGAGDGRVVVAAAKKYGVKAVGFEIDPGLVKLARENVRKQGVEHLVDIRQQDLLSVNLSPASVVTMYLSYDGNLAVRPQLMRQLKAGARVISYTFDMGEWQPKLAESYRDAGGDTHMIYLWQIGEPLAFR